jgi:uncharacterized protein (DUF58 family)
MSARVRYLGALIATLVLLGLLTRDGNLLLLALPLVIYLGAAVLAAPAGIRLRVQRSISPSRATYGRPIQVELSVENEGPDLPELHLEHCASPPLRTIDGQAARSVSLPGGARIELEYQAEGERGEHEFTGLEILASDDFGLFPVRHLADLPDRVMIYPPILRLRPVDIRPQRTHGFSGPLPARRGGSGVVFFGTREYRPGDTLRRINWRATARHEDTLVTNEFEVEGVADVGVILDSRERSHMRMLGGALFEYSVQATAALADRFLRDGHRVGLMIVGAGVLRVFPGYGAVQRERILDALARATTGMSYAFDSLDRLPTRFFPARSQLVVVSPMLPDDLAGLLRFRSLGYEVLVLSADPVDFEIRTLPSTSGLEAAIRLAQIERRVLLGGLMRAGVRVANWPVNEPLDRVLHSALVRQPVQRSLAEVAG